MKYLIRYWDKYQNLKQAIVKAKTPQKAENKWYKENPYTLVTQILLCSDDVTLKKVST